MYTPYKDPITLDEVKNFFDGPFVSSGDKIMNFKFRSPDGEAELYENFEIQGRNFVIYNGEIYEVVNNEGNWVLLNTVDLRELLLIDKNKIVCKSNLDISHLWGVLRTEENNSIIYIRIFRELNQGQFYGVGDDGRFYGVRSNDAFTQFSLFNNESFSTLDELKAYIKNKADIELNTRAWQAFQSGEEF
jgi:hypothetical protein